MSGACLCVCVCAGVCVEVAFSMGSQLHPNPPFIQSLLGTKAVQWAMGNRISRMPPEDVRSDNSVPHHLMDPQHETQEKMPSFETKSFKRVSCLRPCLQTPGNLPPHSSRIIRQKKRLLPLQSFPHFPCFAAKRKSNFIFRLLGLAKRFSRCVECVGGDIWMCVCLPIYPS